MDRALERFDRRFIRFVLVGSSNFLVGMVLFQAAWHAGGQLGILRTPVAQTLAYAFGMAWSFFWNRKWVFHSSNSSGAGVGAEAFRFAIAQILCLLISIVLVTTMIDGVGLPPMLGWLAAMVPLVVLNFFLISRWVFPTAQTRSQASPAWPKKESEHS